jgi:GxxExxY protein
VNFTPKLLAIYQRCLAIEFNRANLQFGQEVSQNIYYEGIPVGTRCTDFVVEDQIIIEVKTVIRLEDIHFLLSAIVKLK